MKKNFKILAIIFSVALNIFFIGSYLYHRLGMQPLANLKGSNDRPLCKELKLTRRQLEQLRPLRNSFHTFVRQQGSKIKAKQLELIDLLATDHPDPLAIKAKQAEIRALQQQMQSEVIDHLLKESKILTPEQRKRFFSLIRARIEKMSGPGPRWMRQRQGSRTKEKHH